MDEDGSDIYVVTEEDQINAARFCRQTVAYQISRRRPTYANFIVKLDIHFAAVQVVITPSRHPQLDKQTIFSLHCKYTLCCEAGRAASKMIGQTVQNIVGVYFLFFGWDFSDEDCFTRDSALLCDTSCYSVVLFALKNYGDLAGGVGREITGTKGTKHHYLNTVEKTGRTKRQRPSTRGKPKRRKPCTTNLSPPRGGSLDADEDENGNEDSDEGNDGDERRTQSLIRNINQGLQICEKQTFEPNFQQEVLNPILNNGFCGSYERCAKLLISLSDKLEKQASMKTIGSFYARILAGCIMVVSSSLPVRPADSPSEDSSQDRAVIAHQKSIAELTNIIVRGLSESWGGKAFLIYHAFAASNYRFHSIRCLGYERRHKIAQDVIRILWEEIPAFNFKGTLFDPSLMLFHFLEAGSYQQICDALRLPPLPYPEYSQISLNHGNHDYTAVNRGLIIGLSEGLTGDPQFNFHQTCLANSSSHQSPLAEDNTGRSNAEREMNDSQPNGSGVTLSPEELQIESLFSEEDDVDFQSLFHIQPRV
ncbi:hypothetical protein GP486_001965 [Trichoglossum hirsutum]|uniref:Uncharacterized protein n=1 Tax=Trichoglossum hirsutum TaxID=265104 RepID=A0A9P8LFU6_9PEZI|nr:hypothetical protein GP486_001965 [Trichoglossum hirsutum]